MTKSELVGILDTAVEALETNRQLVNPLLLTKLEKLIVYYREEPLAQTIISGIFNVTTDQIYDYTDSVLQLIKIEKKLVDSPLTDEIVSGINNLKQRPLVLSMLAGFM